MTRKRTRVRKTVETVRPAENPFPGGLEGGWYRPLSDADIVRVHEAALTVLERTGVAVEDSEARDIMLAAGAKLDPVEGRLMIPRAMVEAALKLANRNVVLYSRDGKNDLHLTGKRVYLGTGGAVVIVVDLETGEARQSRLQDLYNIGRLVDTLENTHFYLRPVVACDLSNDIIDINTFYGCMAGTSKHVMGGCYFPSKVADIKKMGVIMAGSEEAFLKRPFLSMNLGYSVSPLRWATETVETAIEAMRAGIPVAMVSAPLSGATAPASLIGTLVQVTAEELAGLVLVQLVKPGHPILMGGMPFVADLRTGNMIGGAAELGLMNAASAQMTHFYGLPIYNTCGISDSKIPDVQAGFEKAITLTATALAGAAYNHQAIGMLESTLAVAYEQYIIDDEMGGLVMRMVKGLEVNDETLSIDVIDRVVRGEGHYLGADQTLEIMNTEYYYPHTAHRGTRHDWKEAGARDMREVARDKARQVLNDYHPRLIPADVDARLRAELDIALPVDPLWS